VTLSSSIDDSPSQQLELLAGLIPKIVEKDEFRIRSHQKAANLLRSYEDQIDSYEELVQIPGIGPKLAHKIVEIARTGASLPSPRSSSCERALLTL